MIKTVIGVITGTAIGVGAGAVIGFLLYPIVGLITWDAAKGLAFAFLAWKVVSLSGVIIGLLVGISVDAKAQDVDENGIGEFLRRWWYDVSHADWKAGRRAEALLARVEQLEPESTSYSVGKMGGIERREVSYLEWQRADPEYRGVTMQYVQETPDGDLTTHVRWESKGVKHGIAAIHVTIGRDIHYDTCLEGFCFLETSDAGPPDPSHFSINKYIVHYIRHWLEPRAHAAPIAVKTVETQRNIDKQREQEQAEHENRVGSLRKKYLT